MKKEITKKICLSKNGRKSSKIGEKFYKAIEEIKDKRLLNGKSKDRISTEKITNLIVRHKYWKELSNDIINIDEEEVERYGKE